MTETKVYKSSRPQKSLEERWICLECIETDKKKWCIDCRIELNAENAAPAIMQTRRLSSKDKKNILCRGCAEKEWEELSNAWGLE